MPSRRHSRLLEPGTRAPAFQLPRLDGKTATLDEILTHGPALLAFFKISCPVCQFTFPFLSRLHAAGTLQVYGISQNDTRDTLRFNLEYGVSFPVLLDSEDGNFTVSNAFGIATVPTLFLVDAAGLISRAVEGWNRPEMEELGSLARVTVIRLGERVPDFKPG